MTIAESSKLLKSHMRKANIINRLRSGTLLLAMLLLATALCVPALSHAGTRRALVIGLSKQQDTSWGKIHGADDVPIVTAMLRRAGFQPAHIATLTNEQATKQGIVAAFGRLTAACKKGDVVYVHFSGHGQQMTDRMGDEDDHLTECWIPYDAGKRYDAQRDRGQCHLTDDELFGLLTAIYKRVGNTGRILVVVDACHSGGSTMGADNEEEGVRGSRDVFRIPGGPAARTTRNQKQKHWITLSACLRHQSNTELRVDGRAVGRLTYCLAQLQQTRSLTFERLTQRMAQQRGNTPQTPLLDNKNIKYQFTDVLK